MFHFGSLSLTDEPARTTTRWAVAYARERGELVTYDPNLRKPLWKDLTEAREQLLWGLEQADVVKISDEEVEFLFDLSPEEGAERILDGYGVKLLFVTCGAEGCAYRNRNASGRVPGLSGLTGGSYYLGELLYHIDIHGFAPYLDFALKEQTPTRLVFELTSSKRTLAAYPRLFAFRVIYKLEDSGLSITYEVENRDERIMYFGLGAHPGFRVPLRAGKQFRDYRLRFEASCHPRRIGFTDDCFLDGTDQAFPLEGNQLLPLSHSLFDDDAIVLKKVGHWVTLETAGDTRSVSVEFPGMDYLGLWHMPRTDAPYVCIEPWCSMPSVKGKIAVFEKQSDLIVLHSEKIYRNTWSIKISI